MKQKWEYARAKHSLDKVKEIKESYQEDNQTAYASYTFKLGKEIITNGLGQALARINVSSGKDAVMYERLYKDLSEWLLQKHPTPPYKGEDLLYEIIHGSRESYRFATVEALAWLSWHQQFVSTYLKLDRGV
ncbi:type III-B CRISPR module-associated protein Cmr5 [Laceyella tengchongensis]|jgi:CRISPR type III-B/RAMP module-associated protein Cmr5